MGIRGISPQKMRGKVGNSLLYRKKKKKLKGHWLGQHGPIRRGERRSLPLPRVLPSRATIARHFCRRALWRGCPQLNLLPQLSLPHPTAFSLFHSLPFSLYLTISLSLSLFLFLSLSSNVHDLPLSPSSGHLATTPLYDELQMTTISGKPAP